MFDIGFTEMMIIAVAALIVIGPEKLPQVARTLGHLIGRLQRYVNDVKADINREMEVEELRKLKDEFKRSALDIEHSIHSDVQQTSAELRAVAGESELPGADLQAEIALDETRSPDGNQTPSARQS